MLVYAGCELRGSFAGGCPSLANMYGKWEFSVGQGFRIAVYMSPFCLPIKLHVIPFKGLSRKSKVQFPPSALPGGTVDFSPQSN